MSRQSALTCAAVFRTLPDLDDLVQVTYTRIFKARDKVGVEVARPYLFATACNAARDYFRRRNVASFEAIRKCDPGRGGGYAPFDGTITAGYQLGSAPDRGLFPRAF